jgi:predicted RNase H-like HicB family nuclease
MTPVNGYESPDRDISQEGIIEMKFPVVLHKDADSDYGVIVPDVPGCFSAGGTVAQALENVKEALSLHYEGLVADGDPLPPVQEIDAHLDNPDFAGGVWAVVDFDITPYFGKSVRFNATLPEQLLERIDQTVRRDQRYSSRSGFLAAAALRELSA